VTEHRLLHEGRVVLAFQVAENPRTRKPVYLDGDIRRTFLRKGGGDYRAQPHELERMLRDASEDRWDSHPFTRVGLDEGVFHPASLKWYRDRFHSANPGFDVEQPHHDFLYEWGYLVRDGGTLLPTCGAVAQDPSGHGAYTGCYGSRHGWRPDQRLRSDVERPPPPAPSPI
jgi:ATP-dependent DNA helicase RecG